MILFKNRKDGLMERKKDRLMLKIKINYFSIFLLTLIYIRFVEGLHYD